VSLESRVAYLEKLVRTQTDRIEGLANLVDSFDGYIRQLQRNAENLTEDDTQTMSSSEPQPGCDDCFQSPNYDECYDN
jgi:uncharacterized coiled-coil protein SlyX